MKNLSARARKHLIGIDEAGRGPLAGPVSLGVFAVSSRAILKKFAGVKDSKQLSAKQRDEWFARIKLAANKGEVLYSVSLVQAWMIDSRGLSWAIRTALGRCLKKLEAKHGLFPNRSKVLLDGSLYAPLRYADQTTIIDGDAKEPIIALASICAKVLRDRRMERLAREYPHHGFEIHKGYGTKAHYAAMRKHGLTPEHRRSFLKGFEARTHK